ncbi:uncharacterized protein LOC6650723 [Drosophila willistoni]|nr:uncharacterized protein LOC6650723 [Drosophila willistoni]
MSEKHHWAKSAAPTAAPIPVPVPSTAASLQRGVTASVHPHPQPPHHPSYGIQGLGLSGEIPYTSGRFQAPPIHHNTNKLTSPLTIVPVGPGLGAVPLQVSPTSPHTNVPVAAPSGFVPPPFSNASAASSGPVGSNQAVGGGSSVLQPNPFASAANNAAGLAFVNAALNFNPAQQLELGKIMHAMHASGAGTATGPAGAATAPVIATNAPPQIAQSNVPATSRHPGDASGVSSAASAGVINSTIAENVMNAMSSDDKMQRVQQVIESSLDDNAKHQISQILEGVASLKPIEKLFLYLRLPGESSDSDPLRQPQNPLGTRSEINHTINWVRSHLEHDAQVSIPKQDVYNDYIAYCERLSIKPLSTADFGKVMKQVFPGVRPRRLGTRGNSRYCYAAMRKTTKLIPPQLPQIFQLKEEHFEAGEDGVTPSKSELLPGVASASSVADGGDDSINIVRVWAEKLLNTKLGSITELATRIRSNNATIVGHPNPTGKKYTPREPKEKRLLTDMGPLKKRRKKKRKGSTSSESSCHQLSGHLDAGSSQEASQDGLKIKQEITDSPNQTQSYNYVTGQQQQHQLLPMNLAPTEPRSNNNNNAVRNLTPKIMEMSPPVIKNEVEEYNTSNIFCKKVLKAQQTKGFWANSPSSGGSTGGGGVAGGLVPPVITTTSATPPPTSGQLSMGPPLQMGSSISPSSSLTAGGGDASSATSAPTPTPKVASRNSMMLLRAKRLIAAENAAALAAAAEDSGLPENLGLPRERVISICNMDKHELDDYFLPGEEDENSEGADTELLQYFQMGDAEEKQLNSLDALAEQNRIPQQQQDTQLATGNGVAVRVMQLNDGIGAIPPAVATEGVSSSSVSIASSMAMPSPQGFIQATSSQSAINNNVGSASASLALMSRKHQQQQTQQQRANLNPNKRKISLSNASSNGNNKNCIFLPISPNINATTAVIQQSTNPNNNPSSSNQQNCFASPGLSRMRQMRSQLSLTGKQQSLDFDNGRDPMIGATRKRRSYVYSYPSASTTSASAPPSPSLLQHCNAMGPSTTTTWPISASCTNFSENPGVDAMDLETSLALTGNGDDDLELTEIQRSQSVPLSQLHSRTSPNFNRQVSFYSENSQSSQQPIKDVDVDVDTGLLYDGVDVSALISPSFNNKFSSIAQQTGGTTCSSSTGSSSGYSSGSGGSIGIVSRSVPSTPLPHQHLNGSSHLTNVANVAIPGDVTRTASNGFFNISPSFNWGSHHQVTPANTYSAAAPATYSARNSLDISKSMPTTPITTPCFRYSPIEMRRDFLLNGNTIDSLPSSSTTTTATSFVGGSGNDVTAADSVALTLSADNLMDDRAPSSSDVVEAIIGDASDILDNL